MSSSTPSSSSARLWITPLASATLGPPRSSFEISSPVDSFTTGGPPVKIAPRGVRGDRGPAGFFLQNLPPRRLFHHGRPRREDRSLAAHDGEVAHRCHQ